jgi:Domain of unknown function (DUF4410)
MGCEVTTRCRQTRGVSGRGLWLATLTLMAAGLMGCASGDQPVMWRVAGPVDLTRGYRLEVTATADVPTVELAVLRRSIAQSLDTVFHRRANHGDGYTIRVVITRYDEGDATARFMLAGLGQMYLDGDVHVYAGGPPRTVRRGEFRKNYSWGGFIGAAATMQGSMLSKVGDAIATALRAPAGANGASIPPPPQFDPPASAPPLVAPRSSPLPPSAPVAGTTPVVPTIASGGPASGNQAEAATAARRATPSDDTKTAVVTGLPPAVVPAPSVTVDVLPASSAIATPVATGAVTARESEAPTSRRSARRTTGWAFAGVSAAAAVIGIPFGIRAITLARDVDRQCPSGQCSAEAVSLNDDAKSAARVADVAIGVAIVSAGVAAVLLLSSPDGDRTMSKNTPGTGVTLQVGLAGGVATVGVGGRL